MNAYSLLGRSILLITLLWGGLFVSALHAQTLSAETHDALFQRMASKAQALAKAPKKIQDVEASPELQDIGYQEYRSIRFVSDKALWKEQSLFEIQLFHPGFLYKQPVSIYEVVDDGIVNVPFSQELFRYDGDAHKIQELAQLHHHFSGLRVHYPLNSKHYKDELIVFQGASYFRPLSPGLLYGISARGLAIDTAEPAGEEFPYFSEFWLAKPLAESSTLVIYALLDSESVTGAYRFTIRPGLPTKIHIDAKLFARKDIKKLGLAPLTSMFFYGEHSVSSVDDFRPEVHDSDGLLLATADNRWIWRPLSNPKKLRISTFNNTRLKGFGLIQRDRAFDHYQDTEAHYHRRPSLWVTPKDGPWNKGHVELVEIPTPDETNDNVVAYWVPQKPFKAESELTLSYDLTVLTNHRFATLGSVVQTRQGWGSVPGQNSPPPKSKRQFIVDFSGWPDASFSRDLPVQPMLSSSSGTLSDVILERLPDAKTWRVSFKLMPDGNTPSDMTLTLMFGEQAISETWSYVWYPDRIN